MKSYKRSKVNKKQIGKLVIIGLVVLIGILVLTKVGEMEQGMLDQCLQMGHSDQYCKYYLYGN